MENKILNQLYYSCNVTWVIPWKNTNFLKLWPREALTTPDRGMACSMLIGKKKNNGICCSYASKNLDSDCPISATLPKAWSDVAGGDSGGLGMLQSGQLCWLQHFKPNIWAALSPSHPSAWHHVCVVHGFIFPRYNPAFAFCTSCLTSSTLLRRLIASP